MAKGKEWEGRIHHRQNLEKGATMEASQGNAEHVCMEPRLTTHRLSYTIGKRNVRKSPCATAIGSIFAGAGLRMRSPRKVGLRRDAIPTAPRDFRAIQRGR